MQVVIATSNAHKIKELSDLFRNDELDLVSQSRWAVPPCDEPYATFIENALCKARHTSRYCQQAVIADDSGICVNALGGMPGVTSARYANQHGLDSDNNALLLGKLAPWDDRSAYFVCVLVAVKHPDDPCPLIAIGYLQGTIASSCAGENGFGYDPLFIPHGYAQTLGQLHPSQKQTLSHRAQAARELSRQLHAVWHIASRT